MARVKTLAPLAQTAPPVDESVAGVDAAAVPVAAAPAVPTQTRDRDPANREAWKRERARQLGHHR